MGLTQVYFIASEVEKEDIDEDEEAELEGEDNNGFPSLSTEDAHIDQLMDVPAASFTPLIVAPYS
jgi:hypothetical protein